MSLELGYAEGAAEDGGKKRRDGRPMSGAIAVGLHGARGARGARSFQECLTGHRGLPPGRDSCGRRDRFTIASNTFLR